MDGGCGIKGVGEVEVSFFSSCVGQDSSEYSSFVLDWKVEWGLWCFSLLLYMHVAAHRYIHHCHQHHSGV